MAPLPESVFDKFGGSSRSRSARSSMTKAVHWGQLKVTVHRGDVTSAVRGSQPNPYCKIKIAAPGSRSEALTTEKKKTARPSWEESVTLAVTSEQMTGNMLEITVWDATDSTRPLGGAQATLDKIIEDNKPYRTKNMKTELHPHQNSDNTKVTGFVIISLEYTPDTTAIKPVDSKESFPPIVEIRTPIVKKNVKTYEEKRETIKPGIVKPVTKKHIEKRAKGRWPIFPIIGSVLVGLRLPRWLNNMSLDQKIKLTLPSIPGKTRGLKLKDVNLGGVWKALTAPMGVFSKRASSTGRCRGSIHEVTAEDTLWRLAQQYNVPVQKILDENKLYDPKVKTGKRDGKILVKEGLCIVR